jgi:hypothetical protein
MLTDTDVCLVTDYNTANYLSEYLLSVYNIKLTLSSIMPTRFIVD